MPIDHNSPDGRLYYLLRELVDADFIPEEFEEEARNALTTYELVKE